MAWLVALHAASVQRHLDCAASFQRLVAGPLDYFERVFPLCSEEKRLVKETRRLTQPLKCLELPLVFEHGDLSSPNIFIGPRGELGVVDWELGDPHGLPAVDLFFFLAYVALAKNKSETAEECVSAFHKAFWAPQAWAREYIARYREALQLPAPTLKPLFIACWTRYVVGLVARLNDLGAGPREPDQETAAWLRSNRYFHFWKHGVEHADELQLAD
jgi:aminoglycoside phosphotransferase (APT) family kinase protein